jgi:small-conductance mechanosensitive channel
MVPLITFGIALLVFLAARAILLKLLYRKITATESPALVLLNAIRFPSVLWCIAAALATAIRGTTLSRAAVSYANRGIGAFTIISVSLVTAAVLANMIAVQGRKRNLSFAVSGLSRTLTNVVVLSIGALLILKWVFELEITPLLTALGVGGLAVALALQDTLANFFAGVHILVEEPIMVGNFIKLSSGEEGVVKDIGWRTTRIQSAGRNITVIPNTKITSSTLTNYSLPDSVESLEVVIMAAHEADHNAIAELALDIASEEPFVLSDPGPVVSFDPGVLATHLQMKLVVHVPSHEHRGPVLSSIRRRLFEAFRERGIPLPVVPRS